GVGARCELDRVAGARDADRVADGPAGEDCAQATIRPLRRPGKDVYACWRDVAGGSGLGGPAQQTQEQGETKNKDPPPAGTTLLRPGCPILTDFRPHDGLHRADRPVGQLVQSSFSLPNRVGGSPSGEA